MKKKISFIYFDVGGVFCTTEEVYKHLSLRLGHNKEFFKASHAKYLNLSCLGGLSINDVWDLMKSDLELGEVENFDFLDFFTEHLVPLKETHNMAKELVKKYRIGLFTDVELGVFEKNLEKGNIPNIKYSSVIKSCDYGMMKPDEAIFKIAQQKAQVEATEIFYVDDKVENVNAAQKLGWNTFHFVTTKPEASVLQIINLLAS